MTERRVKAAKIASILGAAKAAISNENEWCKDSLHRGERSCALGAIHKTLGIPRNIVLVKDLQRLRPEFFEAADALASPLGRNHYSIPNFNDSPATKHEDVMALFDLAIEEQCKIVREEAEKDDSNLPDQG